jgi:hypothetical protein
MFALRQITAEMLRAEAERDATRDEHALDFLTQGDPWTTLRAELLDVALVLPDYTPTEFETSRAIELLERLTVTVVKLRNEIQSIEDRLAEVDSEAALAYLFPVASTPPSPPPDDPWRREDDFRPVPSETRLAVSPLERERLERLRVTFVKLRNDIQKIEDRLAEVDSEAALASLFPVASTPPSPPPDDPWRREDDFRPVPSETRLAVTPLEREGLETAHFTLNRRTGLWLHTKDGREIVALPSGDGIEPAADLMLVLFDIIRPPQDKGETPDFIFQGPGGVKIEARVKSYSALRRTRATRPRQISAAIAALEARQNRDHVAGRYAVVARILGIPPEKPIVVQRLVASVTKLISNPKTEVLVRFLAPEQVNIDKVITQVLNREKPAIKTRKAEKK